LRNEVARLAVAGAEKILMRSLNVTAQSEFVDRLIAEI
jgi:F0F1-type ATP synthase membrane subunit b/b'